MGGFFGRPQSHDLQSTMYSVTSKPHDLERHGMDFLIFMTVSKLRWLFTKSAAVVGSFLRRILVDGFACTGSIAKSIHQSDSRLPAPSPYPFSAGSPVDCA